ncbi:hypothetical protein [Actinomadura sp. CNU-125]|uniref:hypothetical protein n=1 Tax=Actinomadura sp. CNU-125 TaxID=1904961 RepID=UPI000B228C80|nr:hypothetical protein [Actinomadura sp. CNU-125]
MDADAVFFREWEGRAPGERRSLARARALGEALGVLPPDVPVLTVVGSKGKGTAAVYASAYLAAAGLRVCTVTGPGLRSNRDRIRIDGRAITPAELAALAGELERAIAELPERRSPDSTTASPKTPGSKPAGPVASELADGYLSPAGLFMLAGLVRARGAGADAIVLEAGMGGRSDEVSLVRTDVAAITPVFLEHAGVLGDTPAEIAREKRGVAGPGTRVVSAPQAPEVAGVLEPAEFVPSGGAGVPPDVLPSGLGRASAELGVVLGPALLGRDAPAPPRAKCWRRSSCRAACRRTPCRDGTRRCSWTPPSTGRASGRRSRRPGSGGAASTTSWCACRTTRTWTVRWPRWTGSR